MPDQEIQESAAPANRRDAMFTQASRHDHDSDEGDDKATHMLPLLPDVPDAHAQARPTRRPLTADATPADADVLASQLSVADDVEATDDADVAISGLVAEPPRADTATLADVELVALKLIEQRRNRPRILFMLAAVLEAHEEGEAPFHSDEPTLESDPPIPPRPAQTQG
jgi:hypothetical protein